MKIIATHLTSMLGLLATVAGGAGNRPVAPTDGFDIAEFALPNSPAGEIRFEEPRDIRQLVLTFADKAPEKLAVSYMQSTWPEHRIETYKLPDHAMALGWFPIDDTFNSAWRPAAIRTSRLGEKTVLVTFDGLSKEFPNCADYNVTFRRTLGLKIEAGAAPAVLERAVIQTTAAPASTTLRVMLDAGKPTPTRQATLSGYNARIGRLTPGAGQAATASQTVTFGESGERAFQVEVSHMKPAHPFANDQGLVTFALDGETFTISLESLASEGPIWFEDQGVYITNALDATSFADYQARIAGQKTVARTVAESREQSLGGAVNGQPRPHPVPFHLACQRARQRFWLEPDGDLALVRANVTEVEGHDTARFKNEGDARFFFGLDRWNTVARYPDATGLAAYTTLLRNGDLELEQQALAVPLLKPADDGELAGDDTIVALVRFRFRNVGNAPVTAELPVHYSSRAGRSGNRRIMGGHFGDKVDDNLVPGAPMEPLSLADHQGDSPLHLINSQRTSDTVMRCASTGTMKPQGQGDGLVFSQELAPGQSCEIMLKVPYIELNTPEELHALDKLDFDASYAARLRFWQAELAKGARVNTPEARLNQWHAAHLGHVQITDFAMPNDQRLINTSVGTSTYKNYSNESAMIIDDLDRRGLHDEARRRLAVWLKYQGTQGLRGNFTDHDGVLFGCGGFESINTYDQNHGWALWCLASHYFLTRDKAWLESNADALIKGADWVFRQRRETMRPLPNSRGWEYGFLPAGSLEDVDDYFYWLATNTMSWRGTEWAARALEDIGHPQAGRIRAESDAYRQDLIKGFEKSRQQSPLVRLRDGRWVPNYPSRLYLRGRDIGWAREILEGSVYLILTGMFEPTSKQAGWILDDFQDNRYNSPVYSYPVSDPEVTWFDVGGFCCQPNLLAGLLPYLDRDEPEVYIWMFFNAWAACYREDVTGMSEHPMPILGFSNNAGFKTSDEANASNWLRYMFVYGSGDTLYLGRAIPREWFRAGRELLLSGASTTFGDVSVQYQPRLEEGRITLTADLALHHGPGRILARLRHPEQKPIRSVTLNGTPYDRFDPAKGDVDLTGQQGRLVIEARY